MTESKFSPAMRIQIELAILAREQGDDDLLADEARRLGLTGAEIEAARRGASFNAIADVAVKFALALHDGDDDTAAILERKLVSFGAAELIPHVTRLVQGAEATPGCPNRAR